MKVKLEFKHVTKTFGNLKALDDINLVLEDKKIYGILGRNGAGKTTLMRCLAGWIVPDEGEILLDGKKIYGSDELLSKIFFMSEAQTWPKDMNFIEVAKVCKDFYQDSFNYEIALSYASKFNLNTKKKLSKLSTGYISIYKICLTLAMDTNIVMYDEPVLGLDANHRQLFYSLLVESYTRKMKMILISTHLIEEVSSLFEEVIIIKESKVLVYLPSEELVGAGWSVSGKEEMVEKFISDKKVLSSNSLGGLMTSCYLGKKGNQEGLQFKALDLQHLFIELTNSKEAVYEN
ncbi:MAG: ABC transporter ATP-binding protein [Sphaerochaetaceae bacterium]|nr:ABC transporter ATP-binding protein [Sphaerochaetaceae bacterium]